MQNCNDPSIASHIWNFVAALGGILVAIALIALIIAAAMGTVRGLRNSTTSNDNKDNDGL